MTPPFIPICSIQADLCVPRLNEGDQVVLINGRDISDHTHDQVVMFIKASCESHSGELILLVRPNGKFLGFEIFFTANTKLWNSSLVLKKYNIYIYIFQRLKQRINPIFLYIEDGSSTSSERPDTLDHALSGELRDIQNVLYIMMNA